MNPILSFAVTLGTLGVVASLLHHLILWLGANDLVALLLFGAPICGYIAYCCHRRRADQWRAALQMYLSFSLVVVASAGLVLFIG